MSSPAQIPLLERFKTCYGDFNAESVRLLAPLYAKQVRFTDPLHSLVGWPEVERYFLASAHNLLHCKFEFIDEVVSSQAAFYKWRMHYAHRKIAGGAPQQLTGGSLIQFDTHITVHEDFYDLGALVYEQVPLLKSVIKLLKKRLAQEAH